MMLLRVLLVEDSEDDALLILRELKRADYKVVYQRVETPGDLKDALAKSPWDLVISDYSLPHFSGIAALKIIEEFNIDLPFLMVSGTIDEEMAVAAMKAGANDYLMKGNLKRLVPAVQRELREAFVRSEHQQAEERLREQAALLDVTQDAIIVCNLDDKIRLWNASAERLYGWTSKEVIGKIAAELLFDIVPIQYKNAQKILIKKQAWQGEFQQHTKNKEIIIVESRWKLLLDPQGEPKSILIVNTDITEKKQLSAQFLRSQRLESIGTLAGGIAHDLNNVLAPILMAVQLLKMKLTDPQGQKLLSTMESSAKRGADIVKQVLTFARGVEGDRGEIQIKHLIREIYQMVRETFPKSIEIKVNTPSDLWLIHGDTTQLQQVLLNLCVNARDAMVKGGSLTITAQNTVIDAQCAKMYPQAEEGPYLLLSVADTGIGISPNTVSKIFEPFFTTKPVGKGTGLGLSTSLGIVKSHGGFITVDSQEGKGTCFNVYLPAQVKTENKTPEINIEELPLGEGKLILLVDDEAAIRDISKQTLETYGYRVLVSADGSEALALYVQQSEAIEAVILDMKMPVVDGNVTLRGLRKINPAVKVIAVSGMNPDGQVENSDGVEAQFFLVKPYTANQLLKTLAEMLSE